MKRIRCAVQIVLSLFLLLAFTPPRTVLASSAEPILGEIQLFATNAELRNWKKCDGSLLDVSTNAALFSVIGKVYGGDGVKTFAVPDLRNAAPYSTFSYYMATNGIMPTNGLSLSTIGEILLLPETAAFSKDNLFLCDGSAHTAAENAALFSLIGVRFGGDKIRFMVPNLQKMVPGENLNYYMVNNGTYPTRDDAVIADQEWISSVHLFPYDYVLVGFHLCDGTTYAIKDNDRLYFFLGTIYGGDGQITGGYPDLRGRSPLPGLFYAITEQGIYPSRD